MFEVHYRLKPWPRGSILVSKIRNEKTEVGIYNDLPDNEKILIASKAAEDIKKVYRLESCEVVRIIEKTEREVSLK